MGLVIALFVLSHASGSCLLQEGIGTDFAKIGVTTLDKATANAPPGVIFNVDEHNVVTEIFVVAKGCHTSKGVEIGSPVGIVNQSYGKGKKEVVHMRKGGTAEWEVGDFVLKYPGVEFVISKEKVNAIVIEAPPGGQTQKTGLCSK